MRRWSVANYDSARGDPGPVRAALLFAGDLARAAFFAVVIVRAVVELVAFLPSARHAPSPRSTPPGRPEYTTGPRAPQRSAIIAPR